MAVPKNPGSLDKKYDAPTSGKSPKAVSGIAKTYRTSNIKAFRKRKPICYT